MKSLQRLIEAFDSWYAKSSHQKFKDYYKDTIRLDYLEKLSRRSFIDFFFNFAREGGKIQSGGHRTAPTFKKTLENDYNNLRNFLLEPLRNDFDVISWLKRITNFNGLGSGLATIYLHRVNSKKYCCVNNKSVEAFRLLGYTITSKLSDQFTQINAASEEMIRMYPSLDNLYKVDSLTHFMIGEKEGIELIKNQFNDEKKTEVRYWLYSPGTKARYWDEFHSSGIMALGWDKLGDLNQFMTKEDIAKQLQKIEHTKSSKKNDANANYDFKNNIKVGDIVIVKKGKKEYIGYGIVLSDYFYDLSRKYYQKCRKVDWKKKGSWHEAKEDIVVKTLTDVTKYRDYIMRLKKLIGIEEIEPKEIDYPLNVIFYGPPGTGKTYKTILRAAEIIEDRKISDYSKAREIFTENLHDRIEFITFHQNYNYEDFIQGLRPDIENETSLTFERKDGIFKRIADKALRNLKESEKTTIKKKKLQDVFNEFITPLIEGENDEIEVKMKKVSYFITSITNKSINFRKAKGESNHALSIGSLSKMYDAESTLDILGLSNYYSAILNKLLFIGRDPKGQKTIVQRKNYVIVIDEINRANISRVFGELITLIETDKRSHGDIPLELRLPSGDLFMVPSNLYIIGTMNTADKSIALLDIALRRRFDFESMYPLYEIEGCTIHDTETLRNINHEIIKLKGHDFQIGHSFFMDSNDKPYNFCKRMNRKVVPLLLEYFMSDAKEVKGILNKAGISIDESVWPFEVTGKEKAN